jgi:hypothetical protein
MGISHMLSSGVSMSQGVNVNVLLEIMIYNAINNLTTYGIIKIAGALFVMSKVCGWIAGGCYYPPLGLSYPHIFPQVGKRVRVNECNRRN